MTFAVSAKPPTPISSKRPFISRRDYPKLATLKLGGRTDEQIAKIFGLPQEKVAPHIRRAVTQHRKGKLKVDGHAVYQVAEQIAQEKAAQLAEISSIPSN